MSNNTIEIKINSGGTLEVVTIPVKLYKDSYKAVKLRVKAPKVEGAILKVYGSDRDEAGEEVWTTSAHTLSWKEYVVINSQDYSVYEDYIPEEFCQKNGELYLTFGLGIMDGESWTAILTSGTLNLYVSGEGFNFAGVEIPESDKLAYKINKTFENYEELSANIGRVDILAEDVANAQATSQSALDKSEEALSKVQDMSVTKVLVNGVKVDVFDADTKANTSDLENKVDKVIGKGLSTYDFDDVAKNKLEGLPTNVVTLDGDQIIEGKKEFYNNVKISPPTTNGFDASASIKAGQIYQTVSKGSQYSYFTIRENDIVLINKNGQNNDSPYGRVMLNEDGVEISSNNNTVQISQSGFLFNGKQVATTDDVSSEGGGGTSITVDSELSTTSTNPVQNKVITEALNNINNNGADLTNYYTKDETYSRAEVDTLISEVKPDVDLSDYYTKTEVDDKLSNIGTGTGTSVEIVWWEE